MNNDDEQNASEPSFWVKMHSTAFAVAAIMLSLGQWNDTKDVVGMLYESVITNWTNEVEYEQISQIKVGQTHEYIQSLIGVAQASKSSKVDANVTFYYYGNNKYLLTLAVKNERLSGYSVTGLTEDFYAEVPFTELVLNNSTISEQVTELENYYTDNGNLDYYVESHSLGRNAMFYTLSFGIVNYGLLGSETLHEISELNNKLNQGEDLNVADMAGIRMLKPNVFAISEINADVMVEGLLTRFEYNAYFNN
ncbi:hypothetical protein MD588_24235 [Photobacterium sp. SDRW27]|uniref:ETEC_3214 domain-containing protein n=1 Tax=Photobacterium obscurum TaxID=2829490 RepID=UPI002244366E|nr:ETEC_3214 domain-containing protein [Photobacterium obscurum]MCW8331911.1 hypothetical protein [Photobacterium obscurum]